MILLLLAAQLVATCAAIAAGGLAPAIPSFALAAVLLAARRAPDGRYRWIALVGGLIAGIPFDGALLAEPAALLVTGALARGARRLFPVEGPRGLLATGAAFALAELGIRALLLSSVLPAAGALPLLALIAGLAATAGIFTLSDLLLDGMPRLRHALERP